MAKELSDLIKEYDKAELKLKVADLSTAPSSAQITLVEAQTEAAEKDKTIVKLQENFKRKVDQMVEHHGYHYQKEPDGKPMGPPFCPVCLEKGEALLVVRIKDDRRIPSFPSCKQDDRVTTLLYPDQKEARE